MWRIPSSGLVALWHLTPELSCGRLSTIASEASFRRPAVSFNNSLGGGTRYSCHADRCDQYPELLGGHADKEHHLARICDRLEQTIGIDS